MAAAEQSPGEDDTETVVNNADDVRLDFFSDKFDPLLALRTPDIKIPNPSAKTYDNIHLYKSNYDENVAKRKLGKQQVLQAGDLNVQRMWEPHQLPIRVESRRRHQRNIFTRMEAMKGPLELLAKCKDNRLKIKVWTRNDRGIRGYCLAYITAFDKFWNLALEDVTEVWTRRKKRKVPADGETIVEKYHRRKRVPIPEVTIIKTTSKTETCSRFVEQLLVRGEQVAFVYVINDSDSGSDDKQR